MARAQAFRRSAVGDARAAHDGPGVSLLRGAAAARRAGETRGNVPRVQGEGKKAALSGVRRAGSGGKRRI